MHKKIRREIWDARFYRGAAQQYEEAAFWEKAVARMILSLIPEEARRKISFRFAPGAGIEDKFDASPFDAKHPWDIEFFCEGRLFAYVEVVSRPRISFHQYPSQFINAYKVDSLMNVKTPVFFLYVFPQSSDVERYYWTTRERAIRYHKEKRLTYIPEKQSSEEQENYEVSVRAWERGIESLVDVLSKTLEKTKQTTLKFRKKQRCSL